MITTFWNKEREQVDRDGCSLCGRKMAKREQGKGEKSEGTSKCVELVPFALLFGLEREQGKKE